MKVLTYLGFTLMSILIQFCVMDFIQERIGFEEESKIDLNETSQKKNFEEILNTFKQKPYALYYQKDIKTNHLNLSLLNKTVNSSIMPDREFSTIISSTILDELYDENISTTEDTFTTETLPTTTEFDNITEISLYDKKNNTRQSKIPKKYMSKSCGCNLLYKICDINCCCDTDCSEAEKRLFVSCKDIPNNIDETCVYPNHYFTTVKQTNLMENLFCIAKTNLPQKYNINSKKIDNDAASNSYKWHKFDKYKYTQFQRKSYIYGDPVWVLKEGSIWYIDIPTSSLNDYCNRRKPIRFLKDESATCMVTVKDLEMFQILKTSLEAPCLSVTEKSMNSSALNCSSLHCSNWTITICDEDGMQCALYNKTIHEPSCEENECVNLALRLDYIFYYYDSKIINATIKLYVQKIMVHVKFMTQVVTVKFLLTNETADIVMVSGTPGYIEGLPIIVSFVQHNHSDNFFNTSTTGKFLPQPYNKNGICMFSNNSNYLLFGLNKRFKCRYVYPKSIQGLNSTSACDDIDHNIKQIIGLSNRVFVSPLGNPMDIIDNNWIELLRNIQEKEFTYGQFISNNSKLRCYNLLTRISYVFAFADVSENAMARVNKLVAINVVSAPQNATFNIEDISTVLTIDINFVDSTNPKVYEYAQGPNLHIYLPEDFFFPFASKNLGQAATESNLPLAIMCHALYYKIK